MKQKITMCEVKDLIPYAKNSRTHNENQVNQIASSIKEFGFTNPILIDKDNVIIAGHGRVMAANKEDCFIYLKDRYEQTTKPNDLVSNTK